MTEAELIKKIRGLREIKPRKEWVFLTKRQILGQEPERSSLISFFPRYQLVLSPVLAVFVLIGVFAFSQGALPGDLLYSVKKLTEKGQAFFVSETSKPQYQLEQTNKRLADLTKITKQNQVKKLAPAIDEFQKTLSQATQDLKENPKLNKEIIDQAQRIVENKEKIEETLGVQIGETEEFENILKNLVGQEIKYLESRTLTEEQTKLLTEAKEAYNNGDYIQAFDKIEEISNQFN